MNNFTLSDKSKKVLNGVHPDLATLTEKAMIFTAVDFCVIEGMRTKERQQILVDNGASNTMNSRHLTGHAIDVVACLEGDINWSWPLYSRISDAMKLASRTLNIPIEWGGDWRTFKDGGHFQLPYSSYSVNRI